jgi:NAD(P)-dependent dehydrogenase (short-subunit alcohol dehydrogenase family)
MKAMTVELAPDGIAASAVSPSSAMTDQWEGSGSSERQRRALALPAQRLATPEVARTVTFLLGPEGSVTLDGEST